MKKIRVVLIRHGKTQLNKKGAYLGCRLDIPLCEEGVAEAMSVRDRISSLVSKDAFLICSPMNRCIETAQILFERKPEKISDNLKEMDFGDFEGKTYEDLKDDEYYQKWMESYRELPFPNGESKPQFSSRTVRAFEECVVEGQQNVVVAHGGTIMAVMSHIAGGDYFDYQVANLDGYILEYSYDNDKGTYNEISYMRISDRICP